MFFHALSILIGGLWIVSGIKIIVTRKYTYYIRLTTFTCRQVRRYREGKSAIIYGLTIIAGGSVFIIAGLLNLGQVSTSILSSYFAVGFLVIMVYIFGHLVGHAVYRRELSNNEAKVSGSWLEDK